MNRRAFLKVVDTLTKGTVAFGASQFLTLGLTLGKIPQGIKPYTIETDSAKFILLFGAHGTADGPLSLLHAKLPLQIFNENRVDALFLEGEVPIYPDGSVYFWQPRFPFFKEIIEKATEERVPILTGDLNPALQGMLPETIPAIAGIGGTATLSYMMNKKITRREFLLGATAGLIALWGYAGVLKELMTSAYPYFDMEQEWVKNLKDAGGSLEIIHPESTVVTFRNVLIAEKLLWRAEEFRESKGVRPTFVVAMGQGHAHLEKYLKEGRKFCQQYLGLYPKEYLNAIFGKNTENRYSTVIELRQNGEGKYTNLNLQDPELKYMVFPLEKEFETSLGEKKA